jgi:hypothetical protein
MANQFCGYLSNGYALYVAKINGVKVTPEITVAPCCLYKGQEIIFDSQLLENRKTIFESVTGWTSSCSKCKKMEDIGATSLRTSSFDWIDSAENSQDAISLDIHLDNECNAACVICSEGCSSLWKKENAKLHNEKIRIIKNENFIDEQIDRIFEIIPLQKLKYVKFFGGEPLFTDTHLKFIKRIPNPGQVTLHYTTNGSIYPNKQVLSVWKSFKVIIFAASLDGVGDQFNYVRWPLPWHKVSKNLIRIRENKDTVNVMFRVEFTANFLNSYYYDCLEEWIADNLPTNNAGDKTELGLHPCRGIWGIEKMPLAIREQIMKKYPSDHVMHRLVKNLPEPTSLDPWRNFVETWDKRRNNSWQNAFPDLVPYI